MTYFGFLALFLGIPISILSLWTIADYRRGKWLPQALVTWQPWVVMLGLCIVAFVYTTPWDNYLVATGVWWYDINLVNGLVIGWVPIEEYTFFLVQPVMTGLLLLALMRYIPVNKRVAHNNRLRVVSTGVVFIIWAVSSVVLFLTWINPSAAPFTYLTLELSWALIPVMIQLAFGADILWRHRRYVLTTIVITTLYLSAADAVAIQSGTWTIDPAQSTGLMLGGVLPVEEFIFFLLTNVLISFGITLVLAEESQVRAQALERYAVIGPVLRRMRESRTVNQPINAQKGLI